MAGKSMGQNPGNPVNVVLLDRNSEDVALMERIIEAAMLCNIRSASSINDVLQKIGDDPPDLIITDWILDDFIASELLELLMTREEWEHIPVIVCTATHSQDVKLRAKQLGAYEFMMKPINKHLLRWHLDLLFADIPAPAYKVSDVSDDDQERQTDFDSTMISRIQALAPLPELAANIMEISSDPNSMPKDLADVIKADQVLTAKILKNVNSAYYGFHRKIGNIDRAIVILGYNEIVNITQAVCLIEVYKCDFESPIFSREKFWIHSICAGYVARALCSLKKGINPKDAFVMGLLHDFGKVVMHQHFQDLFHHLLQTALDKNEPLHRVSKELIDIDHAEIGAIITEAWKLPPKLVTAIKHHHEPSLVRRDQNEVHLAHLANYFCHFKKVGISGNPVPDKPYSGSLKALGLDKKDLNDVWDFLGIDVDSLQSLVS